MEESKSKGEEVKKTDKENTTYQEVERASGTGSRAASEAFNTEKVGAALVTQPTSAVGG